MDLPTATFGGTLSSQQQQLATIMKGYWTNLGKRGFPTSFGTPVWPRFNSVTQQMQSLVPPMPQTETNFAANHKCAFWAAGHQGLRPMPQYAERVMFPTGPVMPRSGRHRGSCARPGSTISRPLKNPAICSRLRMV